MLDEIHQRDDNFVQRTVGERHVLVPVKGDLPPDTFLLLLDGPVALALWEALEVPRTGEALVAWVTEHFAVERDQAKGDVGEFLAQLRAAGCLRRPARSYSVNGWGRFRL